jgi:glycine/serine hydroxymethyltransferase
VEKSIGFDSKGWGLGDISYLEANAFIAHQRETWIESGIRIGKPAIQNACRNHDRM